MKKAFFQLHIAVLLAGLTGIFGKLITLNANILVLYRMLLASLVCWIVLRLTKRFIRLPFKEILRIFGVGVILALHWVFFYASVKYSNVSIAVVCFSMGGFFTAIFEPLINRKRISLQEIAVSILTLVGVALIFHFETQYRLGITYGVLCAIMVAFFGIANSKVLQKHSSETVLMYNMVGGTIFLCLTFPFYFIFYSLESLVPTYMDLVYLSILASACTVWMLWLENMALKHLSAFTVNLSFNLEPVYSIILAMLFLGEAKDLSWSFYAGLVCIALSVLLQTTQTLRQRQQLGGVLPDKNK